MCTVSMIMDHYYDKWYPLLPPTSPLPTPLTPLPVPVPVPVVPLITPEEIEEFRKLLDRAREYDRKNNEPDCELYEKKQRLRELAKELGVEIAFV